MAVPPSSSRASPRMTSDLREFAATVETRGWATTLPVLVDAEVEALREAVAPLAVDGRAGARNLLADPRVRALAASSVARALASAVLGDACFAVRAILFDKTPVANWKVVWHQDLSISTNAARPTGQFASSTARIGMAVSRRHRSTCFVGPRWNGIVSWSRAESSPSGRCYCMRPRRRSPLPIAASFTSSTRQSSFRRRSSGTSGLRSAREPAPGPTLEGDRAERILVT